MLVSICELRRNRLRQGRTFLRTVHQVTFIALPRNRAPYGYQEPLVQA